MIGVERLSRVAVLPTTVTQRLDLETQAPLVLDPGRPVEVHERDECRHQGHEGQRVRPDTLVLKRHGRRWRASVACELATPEPRPRTGRSVGIDCGVVNLYATSEGELVENPRHLAASAARLADAQRDLAGRRRGSKRRRQAARRVGSVHRKIRNQRRDLHHRVSRRLVDGYDLVAHEALALPNMTASAAGSVDTPGRNVAAKRGLNRAILDAGWGQLIVMIRYKAEEAGTEVVAVDPGHTSRTCAACGHVAAANRVSQAEFRCRRCGHTDHADVNILRAGLAQRLGREVLDRAI